MKLKALSILCLFIVLQLSAQETKFIEVTGSAEMYVVPDEITFIIGIEEYWEEEFKNKKAKHYKTKVEISTIENQLLTDLNELGIVTDKVKSTEVGNYWRQRGKEFLISKRLEISLNGFSLINSIISKLDRKGIQYMRIGELKNKELSKYRKEVKKKALLAAKEKAAYLLETLDKKLGDVISITEINGDNYFWRSPSFAASNTLVESNDSQSADNEKKIKLRFEIKAKFEIQ
ncbi:MAG: SIMPL domain-containing protein [Winogradskyella sp.]|uniref:SIMPL domain-containing protein n=1 Tax=Winogradskyella sp. TaxID=1883156 RepID=UPI0025D2BA32|nr:SIMPL domain-containing protein [Winogradskyella sp.]NRB60948.1 SIMPL domain-containing protein [Winogradskyella sp.]